MMVAAFLLPGVSGELQEALMGINATGPMLAPLRVPSVSMLSRPVLFRSTQHGGNAINVQGHRMQFGNAKNV
jgi:hypothetical protein